MILMCGLTVSAWAQTVPDAPTALVLNPGDRQIEVEWSAPADAGGSALTDYNVRYRPGSSGGWSDPGFTGTGTSTTITGLTNDRSYQVQVQAVNEQGPGAWSASVSATPATVPAAMVAPTLTPGDGRLLVEWDVLDDDGGSPLTDYNIRYRPDTGGLWTQRGYRYYTIGIRLSGLTNGQSYQVQVQAVNARGPGAWSPSASATPEDRLNPLFAPTLTPGDRQIQVEWASPARGPTITDITGYYLQYRPSGAGSWTGVTARPNLRGSTLTGLTNGQSYEVRVRAEDARGPGGWSPIVTATPGTVPTAPAAPTLTTGDEYIKVKWVKPTAGSTITGYKIRYRQGASAAWVEKTAVSYTRSSTLTGLANGQSYQVQVQALNVRGPGAWSTSASATPNPTVPAAPDAPTLTPGDEQLEVAWSAPGSDGGSAITGYNIQYSTDAGSSWAAHSGTDASTTTTTITDLTNGQRYEVQVQAVNAQGPSAWSASATATPTPAATAPAAPAILTLTPGDRQLEVSWHAPGSDGGSAITDYNVRYSADAGSSWADHPFTGTGTSTTITSLDNGQPYQVQVQALNVRGPGAWSTAATATPAPAATAPAAPAILTLTPGDRQLEVAWRAPGSDGGSPITGYNIQYRAGASGTWTRHGATDAGTTTTTISGLTNGQDYAVQVRAVNAQGPSAWSASATATPASVTTSPEPVTPLGPGTSTSLPEITRFEATPLKDGKSTLSWAVSANTDVLSLVDDQGTVLIDPGDGLPAGNQLAVETRVGAVYTLIAANSESGHSSKPSTVTVRALAPVRPTVRPPTPAPVNAVPTGVIVSWVPPATDGMMAEDVDTSAGPVQLAELSAVDPDADDSHIFSLSDTTLFEITGAALYLKQGVILDYETQPRHGVTLTATDGGGLSVTGTEQALAVTNANEAPTEVIIAWVPPATDGAIAEDVDTSAGPVQLAELSAVDPDADDSHVFSLSGADIFEIIGTALYLKQGVGLDYETQPGHGFTLTATDNGGLSVTGAEQTLEVTDANEAPTGIRVTWVPPVTDGAIAENLDTRAGPVQVATLSATDPDAGDQHRFTLEGEQAAVFEVAGHALYLR